GVAANDPSISRYPDCHIQNVRPSGILTALPPVDIIGPIKDDEHQTRGPVLECELMGYAASHHRKSSWPKPCGLMIGHFREDGAANDDQLLFGRMKVPRNHASRGCLQQ